MITVQAGHHTSSVIVVQFLPGGDTVASYQSYDIVHGCGCVVRDDQYIEWMPPVAELIAYCMRRLE